jgi:hypothetical protein
MHSHQLGRESFVPNTNNATVTQNDATVLHSAELVIDRGLTV